VAPTHPSATTRVDYVYRILFPAGRSGLSPLRRGGYLSGTLAGAFLRTSSRSSLQSIISFDE
ncbi:hypothetical protein, partial [uncultured Porphyromonas sp.]|uniref:hypothetical protein n=1 Tax=uncultured Porphyromonas sp. TaxID=159274 RepID=UPI00258B4C42